MSPCVRRTVDLQLVVPAINEELRLPATLDALADVLAGLPIDAEIVVVDNGSVDATAELCGKPRAVPVSVIGCARAGKGAAVRRGFETSTARWVGFCDADLATAVGCIETAVAALAAGHGAVVGSRCNPASHVEVRASWLRHIGAATFRHLAADVVPGVTETQCGFKFFDGALARQLALELESTGFAFDVELLALALRRTTLLEIPVDWTDVAGSTFSPCRDGVRAFRDLLAIRRRIHALPAQPTPQLHTPMVPEIAPAPASRPASTLIPRQHRPLDELAIAADGSR